MDKKNIPSLDELLNKVRQSEPVMNEDEALDWLNAQMELPLRKHRIKPSKTIIMTSVFSILSITFLLWSQLSTDDSQQTTGKGEQAIMDISGNRPQPQPQIQAQPLSSLADGTLTGVDTPRIDTFKIIKIREEINKPDDSEQNTLTDLIVEMTDAPMPQSSDCKEKVSALEPDNGVLKKLGIVSDGGALMYQQDLTRKGAVRLVFNGLILTNYTTKLTGLGHLNAPEILPLGIMNCRGQWMFPELSEKPLDGVLGDALAVKVPVVGSEGYLIFWFPRNEEIFGMLGPELANEVLGNGDKYHQLPWKFEKPKELSEQAEQVVKIYWEPEETIIPMNSYMSELGFRVNNAEIKFKRKRIKIEISKKGFYIDQIGQFDEEEQFSELDVKRCVPFYITKEYFNKGERAHISTLRNSMTRERDWLKEFSFDKYRMVAFRIVHPTEGTYLIWYPYSPAIREMLNPAERERLDIKLSLIDPEMRYAAERPEFETLDDMFLDERPTTEALNALTPSVSILNKLGVELLPDSGIRVSIWAKTALVVDDFYKEASRFVGIFGDSVISAGRRDSLTRVHDALVYITDDLGSNFHMYVNHSDQTLNSLVPVLVRSGKTYTLHDKIVRNWRPDIILWFKPTPEILAILESEGAVAFWGDISSTEIPDTNMAACRYTEVCRNKAGVFHKQLIFPNPATGFSNFSWISNEETGFTLKLYALNGKEVRAFEGLSARVGQNQYMMDLSNLPPGIYMVILSSDKGDEIHERLVIRE